MVLPSDATETQMSRLIFGRNKTPSLKSDALMFLSGALVALLFVWSYSSFASPASSNPIISTLSGTQTQTLKPDPTTFYDDPDLSYTLETPVQNWDEKRKQWLALNPSFSERVVLVTGSQPGPCKSPNGDHLLLRLFKNKVDYCRIHGYDIFYNNVLLHQRMFGYWAKYAAIRAAMVAHPEAEWIYWVDSDAVFTDMDFDLPLQKYRAHNLVIHGWANLIYEKRSWTGLNAGVLLIRNCQWSMDLMDRWAEFGPQSPDYEKWGPTLKSIFKDKLYPESDDQTALAYLLVKEGNKWGDKVYLEKDYYFEGYWVEIVGKLDNVTRRYEEIQKEVRRLRRKHAEKGGEGYRAQWEEFREELGMWKRPFITHFTGCEPCSGEYNQQMYSANACWDGINKVLNFADNQVLRNFGYLRPDLSNSSFVQPLPFA